MNLRLSRALFQAAGKTAIFARAGFFLPLADAGSGAVSLQLSRGSGSATFTRATTATTILSNGLIASVSSGTARSCYSPSGVYLGYLAERASTNLCLQSQALDNASWATKNLVTITADATAAPDGTTTADKVVETAFSGGHFVAQSITKAASALPYTATCYMKQAERTWGWLQIDDGTNGNAIFFNLATGAVGSNSVVGTGFTSVSASVTQAANGFWRCIVTATSTTATTIRFVIAATTADTVLSYLGVAGSGIFAWGAQLEQLGFATSYIPTTTGAVTRNADMLTYPSSGNVQSQGAMYAEIAGIPSVTTNQPVILQVDDGTSNNRITGIQLGASGKILFAIVSGGVTQASISDAATDKRGTSYKQGCVFSGANNFQAQNAVIEGTADLSATIPTVTTIRIGGYVSGGFETNGTIKNVRIWQQALGSSQLQAITA